ncbi:MAG: LysR substrate-binding domain-containing protein [Solirubrobacteraceae bacterium]
MATQASVTVKVLAGRTLICLPRGTGLRSCLDEAFTASGIQPHIGFEAADLRVLAQLAAQDSELPSCPARSPAHGPTTCIPSRSSAPSHRPDRIRLAHPKPDQPCRSSTHHPGPSRTTRRTRRASLKPDHRIVRRRPVL